MTTQLDTAFASTNLSGLTAPSGPVLSPEDCLGYGQELPRNWRCPSCAVADDCYAHYLSDTRATNGKSSFSGHTGH